MIDITKMKEWNLIPYDSLTITSSMKKDEIITTLNSNISRNTNFAQVYNRNSSKDYEGFLTDKEFRIRRIMKIGYNSFIPIVIGKFQKQENEILITIRPHKFVLIFMGFIVLFGLSMFILTSNFTKNDNDYPQEIVDIMGEDQFKELLGDQYLKHQEININWNDLLIPLIGYLILIVFYNTERLIVKDELIFILKARIKEI